MTVEPSSRQRDLLAAVKAGNVWHYPAGNGSVWPTDRIDHGNGRTTLVPGITVYLVEKHGWATHPARGTNGGRVRWELTAAGREWLANHDKETDGA